MPKGEIIMTEKVDVRPEWWDNIFAPSSCLVLITTIDKNGAVNAAVPTAEVPAQSRLKRGDGLVAIDA